MRPLSGQLPGNRIDQHEARAFGYPFEALRDLATGARVTIVTRPDAVAQGQFTVIGIRYVLDRSTRFKQDLKIASKDPRPRRSDCERLPRLRSCRARTRGGLPVMLARRSAGWTERPTIEVPAVRTFRAVVRQGLEAPYVAHLGYTSTRSMGLSRRSQSARR
jgi:hypothetical protein